ncbi:general transcriptional corepressor CYC8-like [Gouania willdenowi]|uniref:general transcriptional corepressor CYC8-like n=1 Tax=Gouania willdenowi TaxID=441366 RepID=UPI001055C07B|nr:general transcriptional corepressor CYC8-like [Gouania willdenowi]
MIIGHPVFCTTNLLVCVCAFILKCSYCCALLRLLFPVLITWTLTPVADCFTISFDPMSIKAGGGQLTGQRSTERRGAEERVTGRHRLVLREKEKEHGRSSGSSLRSNGSSAASEAAATAAAATAPEAAAAATAPEAAAAAQPPKQQQQRQQRQRQQQPPEQRQQQPPEQRQQQPPERRQWRSLRSSGSEAVKR